MSGKLYILHAHEVYEDAFIVEASSAEEARRKLRTGDGGDRVGSPRFVRIAKITRCSRIDPEKAARLLE